jgi:hypothetical protein
MAIFASIKLTRTPESSELKFYEKTVMNMQKRSIAGWIKNPPARINQDRI